MSLNELSIEVKQSVAVKYFQRLADIVGGSFVVTYLPQTEKQIEKIKVTLPRSYKKFLSRFGISSSGGWDFLGKSEHLQADIDTRNNELHSNAFILSDPDITYFDIRDEEATGFRWAKNSEEPEVVWSDHYGTHVYASDFWAFLLGVEIDIYQNNKDVAGYDFSKFIDKSNELERKLFE
ncbi:MAG TPA: hypothetical protein DCW31_05120 [Lactobacillus sp.]|nr:hypothetical protein [Lactobacillus sp.]